MVLAYPMIHRLDCEFNLFIYQPYRSEGMDIYSSMAMNCVMARARVGDDNRGATMDGWWLDGLCLGGAWFWKLKKGIRKRKVKKKKKGARKMP